LGRLDDIITVSGFRVTPFVGWFERKGFEWNFRREEVAYLLEVPLAALRDPANYVVDRRIIDGRAAELPSYRAGDDLIWGATARILTNFLDVLAAADELDLPNPGGRVLR